MRRTEPRWLEATNKVYVCRFISATKSRIAQGRRNKPPARLALVPANKIRKALDREPWSESDASLRKTGARVNRILAGGTIRSTWVRDEIWTTVLEYRRSGERLGAGTSPLNFPGDAYNSSRPERFQKCQLSKTS